MRPGAALLAAVLSSCAGLQVVPLPPEAEAHRARTDDGWELALTRYRPTGPTRGPPVILCHGIAANARNMDLDERRSMARWFAAQGREAWTLSLRGTGASDAIDPARGRPGPIFFDDYWRHDLPAVVDYVRRVSGAPAIDYAGHSMGGMVLYAYLSQGGQGVHAAATLGSPTRLDWGAGFEAILQSVGGALVTPPWMIPSRLGAQLSAPLQGLVEDGPFQRLFYAPQSTELEAWQRLMLYGTADVAGGTALQLMTLMKSGEFRSRDGALDLRADMAKITTPVLVVAARLDRIAVAPAVKDGYRALGGPKAWLLVTRANGARGEYGHMDLVIGHHAAEEVWARVLQFFDAPPTPGGGTTDSPGAAPAR